MLTEEMALGLGWAGLPWEVKEKEDMPAEETAPVKSWTSATSVFWAVKGLCVWLVGGRLLGRGRQASEHREPRNQARGLDFISVGVFLMTQRQDCRETFWGVIPGKHGRRVGKGRKESW